MNFSTVRRLSSRERDRGAWRAVREICCRTGNNGEPIAKKRWEFFARVWIEPYERLLPQWTYVAEVEGSVVGYLTGCPDTSTFRRASRRRCEVPLLAEIARGSFRGVPGVQSFVAQQLGLEKSAERSFSAGALGCIEREFPAHLHMNIERDFRRRGIGRQLLRSYLRDLRRAAVPGVRLFCGCDPAPFYRRSGFRTIEVIHFKGGEVYAMGRRLAGSGA